MTPPPRRHPVEWPTLLLAVVIHGGWLALTWWHAALPWPVVLGVGGWLLAWHGSLQHETIHGHPTGRARIDGLIGGVPLSLWLPYAVYRRTHLAHHRTGRITDPFDDPESRYLPARSGRAARALGRVEASLLGRLVAGPAITVARFAGEQARRAVTHPAAVARDWAPHLIGVAAVIGWLRFCGVPIGHYILLCVYPGLSLSLLRSFAEHRADPVAGRRVAIVEGRGPLALLFLNNNLHATHHRAPGVAWYRLPGHHARHRAAVLRDNGGLVYRGYGDVARRFLLRPHDRLVHPDHGG